MKLINFPSQNIPEIFYIFINHLNSIALHNALNVKRISSSFFNSLEFSQNKEQLLGKYLKGTVRYIPYEPCVNKMDVSSPSMYLLSAIKDYSLEYDLEVFRESHQPYNLYPSRLSAIYAFGDYESCVEVNKKYGWNLDTVKKFRLRENSLNRVASVNMEIISLLRYAYSYLTINESDRKLNAKFYWDGSGNLDVELPVVDFGSNPPKPFSRKVYSSGNIREYLIEGTLELIE